MKSQNPKSGTAGRNLYVTIGLLAVLAAVVLALSLTRGTSQVRPSEPTRLAGPWFFEQPIAAAGQSAASSQEAAVLRVAVDSGTAHNTSETAVLLESFVTENPGSVWTRGCQRTSLASITRKWGQSTVRFVC